MIILLGLIETCITSKPKTETLSASRYFVINKSTENQNFYFDLKDKDSSLITDSLVHSLSNSNDVTFDHLILTIISKELSDSAQGTLQTLPLKAYFESSQFTVYQESIGNFTGSQHYIAVDSLPKLLRLLNQGNSNESGKVKFKPVLFNHFYTISNNKDRRIKVYYID